MGGVKIGQWQFKLSHFPLGDKMLVGVFCVKGSHRILLFQVPLSDITALFGGTILSRLGWIK